MIRTPRRGQFTITILLFGFYLAPSCWSEDDDTEIRVLRRIEQSVHELGKPHSDERAAFVDLHARRNEKGFRAIYTMDRDGGNVRYLVAGPGLISSATPEWSHNGHYIAFDGTPQLSRFTLSRIMVAGIAGPFRGRLQDLGHGNVPTWSPDDMRIAFMLNGSNPRNDRGGIWVMNSDGSERKYLCDGWYPRWSPDGTRLAIQCINKRPNRIQIYDIETGDLTDILGDEMEIEYAGGNWSPDGQALVFVGERNGQQHVATIDASGDIDSLEILYTEHRRGFRLHGPPAWSPDGEQIVVSIAEPQPQRQSGQWDNTYLYTLSVSDPGLISLLEPQRIGTINRGMSFSPDGKTIAFSSER
ncbi:TolB family protein [Aporhodopirellula aestuarii]|uniref:Translocation protein TolB n=1 Tax=Aporhodopirellula aestuarii TaxID=2950107 RepID=A0ABT0U7R5_9BACT|nr:hypothetical protein [Aporhodopirellula aestuarii]MCM2372979.1 hypothetical protein [Aporhodopirellula aestuarii]